MVLRNLGWALQIALVLVLIAMVCIAALLWGQFGELLDNQGRLDYVPSGGLVTSILLSVVIFIAAELWGFVSWHRFVLLEAGFRNSTGTAFLRILAPACCSVWSSYWLGL